MSGFEAPISLVPDEWYWLSDTEMEYVPVQYIGSPNPNAMDSAESKAPGSAVKAAAAPNSNNRMCEFMGYSGRRMKAPASRIKGRIPAPARTHLDPDKIKADLVQNDDVSEPSVLWALRQRYAQDHIYSSIGSILIAINPYKQIRGLYSEAFMRQYMDAQAQNNPNSMLSGAPRRRASSVAAHDKQEQLEPHIWTIAQNAYHR